MQLSNRCTLFLVQAANDYVAARCCILHALFSGFVLAQQALEKMFKSHIFLHDPHFRIPKEALHSIEALAKLAAAFNLTLQKHVDSSYLRKLSVYFDRKYPDSKSPIPKSSSTAELHDIDRLFISLCTEIALPPELKGRIGIYPWIGDPHARSRPWTQWLLRENAALPPAVLASLEAEYKLSIALPMPDIRIDVVVETE
jgi:hypothetical protein